MPKIPSEKPCSSPPPVRHCSHCDQPMTRFTAKRSGKPYIKCDTCNILRSERDLRIPSCYCGVTAKLRVSQKSSSFGKKFRGCGKAVGAKDRCGFFEWEESVLKACMYNKTE